MARLILMERNGETKEAYEGLAGQYSFMVFSSTF